MWSVHSVQAAFDAGRRELCDQDALFGAQNWPDGTGSDIDVVAADAARQECDRAIADGQCSWRHLLGEEVAEVFAETDPDRLILELMQVMGLTVQWLEVLLLRRAHLVPLPPSGHRDPDLLSSVQHAMEEVSLCR